MRPTPEMSLDAVFGIGWRERQGRQPWTRTDSPIYLDPGMALPHALLSAGIVRGSYNTYHRLYWDEAWRHSAENAHAMLLDDHLQSCYRELYDECLDRPWHLQPDSPNDPVQKAVADGVTRVIQDTPHLDEFMEQLLQAVWYGRYANQVVWQWCQMQLPDVNPAPTFRGGGTGSNLVPVRTLKVRRHLPVNGDKIGYTFDHHPTIRINGSYVNRFPQADIVPDNLGYSLILRGGWRQRFILHHHRPFDPDFVHIDRADAIHGVGDRSWLYYSWWTVNEFWASLIDGIDRYGLGFITVKYQSGNPASEAEADKFARDYSRRAVVKVPVSAEGGQQEGVEVVDTPTAAMQVLLELARHWAARQERFIIGQTLASDHRGDDGLGGGDVADMQGNTKFRRIRRIRRHLDESLTGSDEEPGLVSMIKKYTYPWADFPLRFVSDMSHNPAERLSAVTAAWNLGVTFKADEVRSLTGCAAPVEGDEVLENPQIAQAQAQLQAQAEQAALGPATGPPGPQEAESGDDEGFAQAFAPPPGAAEEAA